MGLIRLIRKSKKENKDTKIIQRIFSFKFKEPPAEVYYHEYGKCTENTILSIEVILHHEIIKGKKKDYIELKVHENSKIYAHKTKELVSSSESVTSYFYFYSREYVKDGEMYHLFLSEEEYLNLGGAERDYILLNENWLIIKFSCYLFEVNLNSKEIKAYSCF